MALRWLLSIPQVVGLTRSMGQRLKQLKQPITVNCICPGLVPTNIMPDAITQVTPPEYVTPLTTIVRAVEGFVLDEECALQGQVAECSAQQVVMRPLNEYLDEASKHIFSGLAGERADRELLVKQIMDKKAELANSIESTA